MTQTRINTKWYVVADVFIAAATWIIFYYLRSVVYNFKFSVPGGFYIGWILYTAGWIFLNYISGIYSSLYRKSRFNEFSKTILITLIGCLFLLFFFILKNPHADNSKYYKEFFILLLPVLLLTCISRFIFLNIAKKQLQNKKVYFNTLLTGTFNEALKFYKSFKENEEKGGLNIIAFLPFNKSAGNINGIEILHPQCDIETFIKTNNVEEIIIAVPKDENLLKNIFDKFNNAEVNVSIVPGVTDIISGAVQTNNITGVPLITVHTSHLKWWQQNVKRLIDVGLCIPTFIILSPLILFTIIKVRLSSPGPVIFKQQRLGYKSVPFTMYKFRSMFTDAEKNGPLLSSSNDTRITKWGKTMRKWRIDELPQLYNILKGEMSFVGPRPERKFYADQIIITNPEFKMLFKVKPGLTSWGMVKFGYASSLNEMIQRLPYDLMYVENVSLTLDFKIMLYTIKIIFQGKGK